MGRGKKTNRLYILHSEWVNDFHGKSAKDLQKKGYKPLPYYYCCLSLQPVENAVMSPNGDVFEENQVKAFINKYQKNPVTGDPLAEKDLIKLNFAKTSDGKYCCASTGKEFTDNSHIVTIRTSGNVYSYEAVEELNIKGKIWKDILTDVDFKRSDIVTLNDPTHPKLNWAEFYHIRNKLTKFISTSSSSTSSSTTHHSSAAQHSTAAPTASGISINQLHHSTSITPKSHSSNNNNSSSNNNNDQKSNRNNNNNNNNNLHNEDENTILYDGGFTCAGFTAKDITPQTDAQKKGKITKKKGYVSIVTNFGNLNLELHCDLTPKTAENFLLLCHKNFYDNVTFHRLIKNFMIQGGDPTGTGTGGESAWGEKFFDEFKPNLSHSERGIVSMANSGPNTNSSQFFILFRPAKHLDNKHTVFGRLVGGFEVLNKLEAIPTSELDVPLEEIKILKTEVFSDPFLDDEQQKQAIEISRSKGNDEIGQWYSNPNPVRLTPTKSGVGKYIKSDQKPPPSSSSSLLPRVVGEKSKVVEFGVVTQESKKRPIGKNNSSFSNF